MEILQGVLIVIIIILLIIVFKRIRKIYLEVREDNRNNFYKNYRKRNKK